MRSTSRNIINNVAKNNDKERILNAATENSYIQRNSIRLPMDFSAETLQASRKWYDIFKVLKGKHPQPRKLYLAKLSFRTEGEIKHFPDKS